MISGTEFTRTTEVALAADRYSLLRYNNSVFHNYMPVQKSKVPP